MYHTASKKWFLPVPRTGSSAVLTKLLRLNPSDGPIPGHKLPYPDRMRHPSAKDVGVLPGHTVVVTVRNPIDRWNSIKRFIEPRQNNLYRKNVINSGISYHLLQMNIDSMCNVDDVTTEILRYETLAEDFSQAFPSLPALEQANHVLQTNIAAEDPLTWREVDLIKKLSPTEWSLYLCDEDDRVKNLD